MESPENINNIPEEKCSGLQLFTETSEFLVCMCMYESVCIKFVIQAFFFVIQFCAILLGFLSLSLHFNP